MIEGLPPLHVLYEDNHLLVVNKPVLLPTMGVAADRPSLVTVAKEYIRKKFHKPGNVYLGVVSRLDAPVSGVVLIARTSKAAARLADQFRRRRVEKTYWALVDGRVTPPAGALEDYVRKDERHRRMHICGESVEASQWCRLTYRTLRSDGRTAWLETLLETGRKHQIRVQWAHRGHPVLGDRKYGSNRKFPAGIALHARRLAFEHPVRKTRIDILAPLPQSWDEFLGT